MRNGLARLVRLSRYPIPIRGVHQASGVIPAGTARASFAQPFIVRTHSTIEVRPLRLSTFGVQGSARVIFAMSATNTF